jgi:hypothetical protein
VWFSLILTRLARSAFTGPSPLFIIDATTPGSGKTMLARLAGLIVDGVPPGMMSLSGSDEENRKAITSLLQEGASILVFDNVSGMIKSPTLDRFLTATEWRDRILGKNKTVVLPNMTVPVVTVNNCEIQSDTARRAVFLRLSPADEKPEERTFRIPDLDDHVHRHRRELLIAAIRILQWFVVCGRPQQKVREFGSFSAWSSLVRQAVIHAGLPDPLITASRVDTGRSAFQAFLEAWWFWDKAWQGSARHLVEKAFGDSSKAGVALQESMLELVGRAGVKDGRPDPQVLGNFLGRIQGRNFSNLKLVRSEGRVASGYIWRIVEVNPSGSAPWGTRWGQK